jgi:DNA polymerase
MAQAYGSLRASVDMDTSEKAERAYIRWSKEGILATDVMSREAWIASDITKRMWREKHPATTAWWDELAKAVFEAVTKPGTMTHCGRLSYIVKRGFLWCRLPSGRCLAYGSPDVRMVATPWGEKQSTPTALGVDSITKKWRRFPLTRQILSENPVQAVARDCMRDGMLGCDRAGYPIVLTVHDEAVADTPNGFGSLEEFEHLLSDMPAWAEGLPVVATGFEAQRYRK